MGRRGWGKLRVLINASNLDVGGGVAVASSVLDSISAGAWPADSVSVLASERVDANLKSLGSDTGVFARYQVANMFGPLATFRRLPMPMRDIDVVLNIFGPVYNLVAARRSIMGFARPWIAFPHNDAYRLLNPLQRLTTGARNGIQSLYFLLAERLVVEQETVRDALRRHPLLGRMPISVVPNTVDSVFLHPERWEGLPLPPRDADLRLGLVSRAYPHKNLGVLPEVCRVLRDVHGLSTQFLVTLTEEEWQAQTRQFREEMTNVGPLRLAQAPTFISSLDGVVFPTLLECFSAVPLETGILGVPLFASDLPTVRATVSDRVAFFDPNDPRDIAGAIAQHLTPATAERGDLRVEAPSAADTSAAERARRLMELCEEVWLRRANRASRRSWPLRGKLTARGERRHARTGEA